MSYQNHMKGYQDTRTLYQIDSLYAWKHDQYFPPVSVEISPTHACNQKCKFCYTHGRITSGETMRDDILIKSITQLADAGVQTIFLQGTGEPLMHKSLVHAIEAGGKRNLTIALNTNGVLLDKKIQERILEHLFFIRFSVLDNNPKRYAYWHGCSDKQWEKLIDNIKYAVHLRNKYDLQLALLGTVYIQENSLENTYDVIKYFKEMGLDYIIIQEATFTEYSPAGKRNYASSFYSKEQIEDMKEKVLKLSDNDFQVKIQFPFNDDTLCSGLNKDTWKNDYCQGIKFHSLIASDGGVYPCWRVWGKKAFSYGSLYENSFEEIWKGEKRRKIEIFINHTPPDGQECSVCCIPKLNEILYRCKNATKWKGVLV